MRNSITSLHSSQWPRIGKGARLLLGLVTDSLRHPSAVGTYSQAIGALIEEQQFAAHSPLEQLDGDTFLCICRHPIVVPPSSKMHGGNQSVAGLIFLASLARSLDARCIFEIGTYNGLTAWSLASNAPLATVHTLDLPPEEPTALAVDTSAGDIANRKRFERLAYQELGTKGQIVQHWGDSATFDFTPWAGRCDLVYVDGAHSCDYVRSDTDNALRMVSSQGAVVWDDYWWRVRGVAATLDPRTDIEILRVPGTRLAVYLSPGARRYLRGQRQKGATSSDFEARARQLT